MWGLVTGIYRWMGEICAGECLVDGLKGWEGFDMKRIWAEGEELVCVTYSWSLHLRIMYFWPQHSVCFTYCNRYCWSLPFCELCTADPSTLCITHSWSWTLYTRLYMACIREADYMLCVLLSVTNCLNIDCLFKYQVSSKKNLPPLYIFHILPLKKLWVANPEAGSILSINCIVLTRSI